MILLHCMIFWRVRDQIVEGMPDFRIFYTAGLMLRRGQAHSLYDDGLQAKTQREFVSRATDNNGLLPYNHPPFEAILYLGLTCFTFIHAYWVWFLVNGLLLAITLYVIRSWIPATAAEFPVLLFLAPLAFYPTFVTVMNGQDSILLLTLYCLAYAAFRRERDLQAGICLGLGLFKFHLVLPFGLILLLRRRWRALAGMLLSACGEIAVSCALVGWRELVHYPSYVWHVSQVQAKGVIGPVNMPNLRGLLSDWVQSLGKRMWPEVLLAVLSLCLLAWAANQWGDWELRDSNQWNTGFSIAVITTFLAGYHGYNHDLSIALVPILITFDHLLQHKGSAYHTALRIILVLLFLSPMYLLFTLQLKQEHFFALVLLAFVFCLAASCRDKRGGRALTRGSISVSN
jgi:hypothetical protein